MPAGGLCLARWCEVIGCRMSLWFATVGAVAEKAGWVVDGRCHRQRGFWKGKTSAGPWEK